MDIWKRINEHADALIQEERKKSTTLLRVAELLCGKAIRNGGWVTFELPPSQPIRGLVIGPRFLSEV